MCREIVSVGVIAVGCGYMSRLSAVRKVAPAAGISRQANCKRANVYVGIPWSLPHSGCRSVDTPGMHACIYVHELAPWWPWKRSTCVWRDSSHCCGPTDSTAQCTGAQQLASAPESKRASRAAARARARVGLTTAAFAIN